MGTLDTMTRAIEMRLCIDDIVECEAQSCGKKHLAKSDGPLNCSALLHSLCGCTIQHFILLYCTVQSSLYHVVLALACTVLYLYCMVLHCTAAPGH